MIQRILSERPAANRRSRRLSRRGGLAAIAAVFFAVTTSANGGDRGMNVPGTLVPSAVPAGQLQRAHPVAVPQTQPDHDGRVVDQLYEELMHWVPPVCSASATAASLASGC